MSSISGESSIREMFRVSERNAVNQGKFLTPFQTKLLLKNLEADLRPEYRRRIEIMLLADRGYSQAQICDELGCSQETARYWINMVQTGQAHKWNGHPIGRPKTVNDRYLERLKELVQNNPRDYGYPFQSWTAQWLGKHLAKEFGIKLSSRHVNRLLQNMGLSRQQRRAGVTADHFTARNSSIVIRNLPSSSPSEDLDFWPFQSV